jgi:hypothetical protein
LEEVTMVEINDEALEVIVQGSAYTDGGCTVTGLSC